MSHVLYESAEHRVVVFNDLVRSEEGVQANQFLVQHRSAAALIDPGGALLYTPLSLAVSKYLPIQKLTWIIASHQDPDIIGAADRCLSYTQARIAVSRIWGRFLPHLVPHFLERARGEDRYLLLPDEGGSIPMDGAELRALPAHFLHSVGNFSFYDPVSGVLFSGDVGSSLVPSGEPYRPVEDFRAHLPRMEGFHRRYMASNRACRLWVRMVRRLQPKMIVPQHGLPFADPRVIAEFLDWLEGLSCGADVLPEPLYAA
ncbi:MAG: hypothetical protein KatS3mg125_0977 [Lysobacterales bacterium]|nr:MAG: hypothetical protein KatS3mg125_0977 [Xanthomonadales bacterium]